MFTSSSITHHKPVTVTHIHLCLHAPHGHLSCNRFFGRLTRLGFTSLIIKGDRRSIKQTACKQHHIQCEEIVMFLTEKKKFSSDFFWKFSLDFNGTTFSRSSVFECNISKSNQQRMNKTKGRPYTFNLWMYYLLTYLLTTTYLMTCYLLALFALFTCLLTYLPTCVTLLLM